MTDSPSLVHVIDGGGSHVTAALTRGGEVVARVQRDIDAHASVDEIVGGWAAACLELGAAPGARWGIAMPDPFDFERAVGTFENVAKFERLANVDLRAELAPRLATRPENVRFVHD